MGLFKSVFNYIFKEKDVEKETLSKKEIVKNNTEEHIDIEKDNFFEYLENKLNNYQYTLTNLIEKELDLTEGIFLEMLNIVNEIKHLNDDAAYNGNKESLINSFIVTKNATIKAIEVRNFLSNNHVLEIGVDEIISAFYILNLAIFEMRDTLEFKTEEIKNILVTIYICATGDLNGNISNVTLENVKKIRFITKWLESHKFN